MKGLASIAAIAVAAALVRLPGLDTELWFDEVVTHLRLAGRSFREIAAMYDSQNQHVLYSLLAKLSVALLGDTPAALRAPAVAFGVLSIVAIYLLGREMLSRREALLAAALLAVSYEHVWFSQNARGYTGLLFWTLLASWLLLRALAGERRRDWIAYGVAFALGLYTHLTMLFVLGGHLAIVGIRLRRRSVSLDGPALGLGLAAVLGLALYAPILSRVLVVSKTEGRRGDIAEWTSARWALGEVAQTLSASFVAAPVAAAAVGLGLIGIARLARSRSELLWLLFVPTGIGAAVAIASGHHLWPRLFFFAIGFAALAVAAGISALAAFVEPRSAGWLTRTTVFRALAALIVVAAATSLPRAFGIKQRFRDPMALVDGARRPGDVVLVTGSAELVYQKHYGKDWRSVRTRDELEAARAGAERTWLVHTFPIQLHARWPDVERALAAEFELAGHFVGTLRGGDVLVWRSSRDGGRGVAAAAPLSSAAGFE